MTPPSKRRRRHGAVGRAYELAQERYALAGVSTEHALKVLATIPISIHCWQGDDVRGLEGSESALGGGLAVTGNHPGRARNADELRTDLEKALSLIPGSHRVNLHAMYGEFGHKKVDRDEIEPTHFASWIVWAKARGLGLDFNPTFFAHPKAADGFTLAHRDKGVRQFWIEHGIRCREIGAAFGAALGKACVTNVWVPDGSKDTPADRRAPRERLAESLGAIFKKSISPTLNRDAVEPKLFGLGSESYVVGSHEFYFGYALTRRKLLTLDAGHFHPTENIADKISSTLQFLPEILLHVSRGVRWDSDHVVTLNDDLLAIAREIVANNYLDRVHIGLDYFDASINRIAAWVIGARNVLRALLIALLEPTEKLRAAETMGDYTTRLAVQEEAKALPFAAVWDEYCEQQSVPRDEEWLAGLKSYEREVLLQRQ